MTARPVVTASEKKQPSSLSVNWVNMLFGRHCTIVLNTTTINKRILCIFLREILQLKLEDFFLLNSPSEILNSLTDFVNCNVDF